MDCENTDGLANVSDPIARRKEKQKSRRRGERTIDLRKLQALKLKDETTESEDRFASRVQHARVYGLALFSASGAAQLAA